MTKITLTFNFKVFATYFDSIIHSCPIYKILGIFIIFLYHKMQQQQAAVLQLFELNKSVQCSDLFC